MLLKVNYPTILKICKFNPLKLFGSSFQSHQYSVLNFNNDIVTVQDSFQKLSFMSEIQCFVQGSHVITNGIVLKVHEQASVALYNKIDLSIGSTIHLKKINQSYKQCSFDEFNQRDFKSTMIDVTGALIQEQTKVVKKSLTDKSISKNLFSGNLILDICYDLQLGQMISFIGCQGSNRTKTALQIIAEFNQSHHCNHTIYVNPFAKADCTRATQLGCSTFYGANTNTSTYMLVLKAILLSQKLQKIGKNILLVLDNFKGILYNEWSMLQSIHYNLHDLRTRSQNKNHLKIAPISILNEIYSSCSNQSSNTFNLSSFSSIIITEDIDENMMKQQLTPYNNNIKNMLTLVSKNVKFPINIVKNHNIYNSSKEQITQENKQQILQENKNKKNQIYRFMRTQINKYLQQKQNNELKSKVYPNSIREEPWDYYYLLDSQWWIQGIKTIPINSIQESQHLIQWCVYMIAKQLCSQWNIQMKNAYAYYLDYLKDMNSQQHPQQMKFNVELLEDFIQWSRLEGNLSPFKKDYLL